MLPRPLREMADVIEAGETGVDVGIEHACRA